MHVFGASFMQRIIIDNLYAMLDNASQEALLTSIDMFEVFMLLLIINFEYQSLQLQVNMQKSARSPRTRSQNAKLNL